jgi:hypothetical protein
LSTCLSCLLLTALSVALHMHACMHAGVLEAAFTLGMLFLGRKTLQSARR